MNKNIVFIFLLLLAACAGGQQRESSPCPETVCEAISIPAGFSVVERNADGNFIRVSSPERVSVGALHALAEALSGAYERIDVCLDAAHERGDEYLSIIAGKVYDYENDNIYPL